MKTKVTLKTNLIYLLLAILFLMSSCISQKKTWLMRDAKETKGKSEFPNNMKSVYKVQPGDHLYIKVYSVDKQTSKFFQTDFPTLMNPTYLYLNSFPVNEDGYINFSFIEKMYVKGSSVEDVQKNLQTTMNEYFKDVTVFVKLVNYKVTVMGEVENEGEYTITQDQINILQAVALAGGVKDYGNRKKVLLIRQDGDKSIVYNINLTSKNILESDFYYLLPNDIIYVKSLSSKSFSSKNFPYAPILSALAFLTTLANILYINNVF